MIYNLLEVRNLTKIFPEVVAVNDVSLTIRPGEVVGLVGPNGAGKTTLIRCIIGLENPERGDITIFGHDRFSEPHKAKAGIAHVPEVADMVQGLTVWEHINFIAAAYGATGKQHQAMQMLQWFDLLDKVHEHEKNLSKGQAQKVMVISAFIHDPGLIFFDEPLIGIDPKGGKILKDMILQKRNEGGSVLVSSHMLDLIEEISDRVIIMDKGRIIREGSIEELKEDHFMQGSDFEDVFIKITGGFQDYRSEQ